MSPGGWTSSRFNDGRYAKHVTGNFERLTDEGWQSLLAQEQVSTVPWLANLSATSSKPVDGPP